MNHFDPFNPRDREGREAHERAQAEYIRREQTGQEAGIPGQTPPPRVFHQPGADVLLQLQSEAFETLEEYYQVLPDEGWFDPNVSPQRPVQFTLGAFQVPKGMNYWMFDYNFTPFRLSGQDPGDLVPVEDQRLHSVLGFDVTVSTRRKAHLLFQLDPVTVPVNRPQFNINPTAVNIRPVTDPAIFNAAAAGTFASTASPGLSLLPAREQRMGPQSGPFTIVARENEQVALSVVIFRPIPIALGSIVGRHAGYLVGANLAESLYNRMRPK